MKTKIICVAIVVMGLMCFSSPVKSLIGCMETAAIEESDDTLPDGAIPVQWIEIDNRENRIYTPLRFCDLPYSSLAATVSLNPAVGLNTGHFFGCIASTIGGYFNFGGYENQNMRIGYNTNSLFIASYKEFLGTPKTILIDFPNNILFFDGSELSTVKPKVLWDTNVREACKTYTTIISLGRIASSTYGKVGARFHSVRCEKSSEMLFDFQPVRFKNESNEWEGAMYDRISKQLFRNSGTGAFICGPDKK